MSEDNISKAIFTDGQEAVGQTGGYCWADEIVLSLTASDRLQIAWGGIVSQKAGVCPAFFGGDESYWIVLVNRGTLRLKVDDKPINVEKGKTLLVLPYEVCVGAEPLRTSAQWQWLAFRVAKSGRRSKSVTVEAARSINAGEPGRVTEIFRFLIEDFHSHRRDGEYQLSTLGTHHLMLSLLARLDPREAGTQQVFSTSTVIAERAKDYVRIHINDPIRTYDVARALDCSTGYLSTSFSKAYGETLSSYILRTKLGIARNFITQTRKSFGQIANEFGFTSLNYFTRAFKRHHGMSPREYRNAYSHRYITTDI